MQAGQDGMAERSEAANSKLTADGTTKKLFDTFALVFGLFFQLMWQTNVVLLKIRLHKYQHVGKVLCFLINVMTSSLVHCRSADTA